MPTTDTTPRGPSEPEAGSARSWQPGFRTVWAAALTGLLGLLFTVLTATTVTLWATDASYSHTNPVVDLAFFALGGILVTAGFAVQIRTPSVAGLQQTILALVVLLAAGWLGDRVEPFIGSLVLLAATTPLVVFHPRRRQLRRFGGGVSGALALMAVLAAGPAMLYAASMLDLARAAGPSCFFGQCVEGDRYAEVAALVLAVVLVALLASVRTPGWLLPAWSAGTAAAVFGITSLMLPGEVGAVSPAWAVTVVVWSVALVAIAMRQHRPTPGPRRPGPKAR
jgi:hypothetical protein